MAMLGRDDQVPFGTFLGRLYERYGIIVGTGEARYLLPVGSQLNVVDGQLGAVPLGQVLDDRRDVDVAAEALHGRLDAGDGRSLGGALAPLDVATIPDRGEFGEIEGHAD